MVTEARSPRAVPIVTLQQLAEATWRPDARRPGKRHAWIFPTVFLWLDCELPGESVMSRSNPKYTLIVLAALALAACNEAQPPAADAAGTVEAETDTAAGPAPLATSGPEPAASSAPLPTDAESPVTLADLDAYVRALEHEVELYGEAAEQVRAANDTTAKQQAVQQLTLVPFTAAQKAGLSAERYDMLKTTMDKAIGGDDYAGLGAEVVAAIEARRAEIETLQQQTLELPMSVMRGELGLQ